MITSLGSLIISLIGIPMAFFVAGKGDDLWSRGRRVLGAGLMCAGLLIAFESTIGFLFGLDLWSIGARFGDS